MSYITTKSMLESRLDGHDELYACKVLSCDSWDHEDRFFCSIGLQ